METLEPWPGVVESRAPQLFEELDSGQVNQISSELTAMFADRTLYHRIWVLINIAETFHRMLDPEHPIVAETVTSLIRSDRIPFVYLGSLSAWNFRDQVFRTIVAVMQWFWSQATPEDERAVSELARENTLLQIIDKGMSFGNSGAWLIEDDLHEMVSVLTAAFVQLNLHRTREAPYLFNSRAGRSRFLWAESILSSRFVAPRPWISLEVTAERDYWD